MSTHRQKVNWHNTDLTVLLSCALLIIAQFNFITSMSLERLSVERNDLQQKTLPNGPEEVVIDDDRRLTPVPTENDQPADMYMLLPSLDKNTIETDPNVPDGETDMLMVESNDVPVVAAAPAVNDEEKSESLSEESKLGVTSEMEEIATEATVVETSEQVSSLDHNEEQINVQPNEDLKPVSAESENIVNLAGDESLSNSEVENVPTENENVLTNDETVSKLNVTAENNNNYETVLSTISDMVGEVQSLMESAELADQKQIPSEFEDEFATTVQPMENVNDLSVGNLENSQTIVGDEKITDNEEVSESTQSENEQENEDKIVENFTQLPEEKLDVPTDKDVIEEEMAPETVEEVVESETLTEVENNDKKENEILVETITEINAEQATESIIDINMPIKLNTETVIEDQSELSIETAETTEQIVTENVEKVEKLEIPAIDQPDKQQLDEIETESISQPIDSKPEVVEDIEKEEVRVTTEFPQTLVAENVENESEIVTEKIIIDNMTPQDLTLENSENIFVEEEIPTTESSSLQTTMLQVPIQTVEDPIKMENIITYKPEMPIMTTNYDDNKKPPLNVIDSVLNYVNASFINNNKQQQQQQQQLLNDEDKENVNSFRPSLRSYEGAQVWRIVVQNDKDRKLADELRTKYGKIYEFLFCMKMQIYYFPFCWV